MLVKNQRFPSAFVLKISIFLDLNRDKMFFTTKVNDILCGMVKGQQEVFLLCIS